MADETTTTITETATGASNGQNAGSTTVTLAQEQADAARITLTEAQLAERLQRKEAQVLARIQKEQSDKDAAAREKQLKEQGEYEALLGELKPQLFAAQKERDALQTERDALHQHVTDYVTKQVKDWPTEFRALVPDTEDALARWKGYETAAGLYAKYGNAPTAGSGRAAGNTPGPRPAVPGPGKSLVEQETERLARTGLFARG